MLGAEVLQLCWELRTLGEGVGQPRSGGAGRGDRVLGEAQARPLADLPGC